MQTHAVRSGDALDKIAGQYGTDRATLVDLNPWLRDRPNLRIYADQDVIRLPYERAPLNPPAPVPAPRPVADTYELAAAAPAVQSVPEVRAPARLPEPPTPQLSSLSGGGLIPRPPAPAPAPGSDVEPVPVPAPAPEPEPVVGEPRERPAELAPPALNQTLRLESEGPMVGLLQQRLTELGFDTPVDEDFGPGTRGQVEAYQRWAGLDVDGAVGQNTWAMLWHQSPSAVGERMLVHDGAVEYLERIGFNETVANNPDYDDLAILEAQHASQLLVDLGFPDLENAITPELLKAMWLRESVLDHEVRNRNGRGLGQITQTGFRGMWDGDYLRMTDLPREEVRELEGSGGWLSLARVHSGEWPSEYSQAFDYFDQNYDVAALNASLSTVWLVAQLVQNADERSPTREALVDYNGSRHKQVYARTVLRLRNGYVPRVTSGPNPS